MLFLFIEKGKMSFKVLGFTYCFLTVCVLAQNVNSLDFDDVQKQLMDNAGPDLNNLGKALQENGVPNLDELELNTKFDAEKVENAIREKCEKLGASNAVDLLKAQQESVRTCVTNYINVTQIQEELEEAKKTGSMDDVFAKYCRLWPDVKNCGDEASEIIRQCLTEKEKKAFNQSLDIMTEVQEFICFKDGDRLAMFVAEGGVECLQERQDGLKMCLNSTLGDGIPETNDFSAGTLPSFLFSSQYCSDFDTIRTCINEELEKCADTTPANIVEAFLKFLKKQLPCDEQCGNVTLNAGAVSESSNCYSVVSSIFVTLFLAVFVKFC